MRSKRIILIGGFCEMFDLCRRAGVEIVGVVDQNPEVCAGTAIPYLGQDEMFLANKERYLDVPLVITPDKPSVRRCIWERYRAEGFSFSQLIAPDADISLSVSLGEGCVIQSHVIVMALAQVGSFVKLNTASRIMHEGAVGDNTTVAPCAVLLGRVHVAEDAYIGANSTILPGVSVGKRAVVGAGAVVTKDVAENQTVVGVPARGLPHCE